MKKSIGKFRPLLLLLAALMIFSSCRAGDSKDKNGTENTTAKTNETTNGSEDNPQKSGSPVDIVLFIGQSNMAGRGTASKATVVPDGHAYEFRAISDPTKLYPVKEPFGVNENNKASGVSETKKTGSMVSAICESYYTKTGVPIVAVSCSQGATDTAFWSTEGLPFADACERLEKAQSFIEADEEYYARATYIVWLQGEQDAGALVKNTRYITAMKKIFNAFMSRADVDHCFVIPIGGFNGADETKKASYVEIRQAQIDYCAESDTATAISTQLYDFYLCHEMVDNAHYTQEAYEAVGKDAGANMAYFVINGKDPVCTSYKPTQTGGDSPKTGGAWLEKDGLVAISAASALENSPYAAATSRYYDSKLYYWTADTGSLSGVKSLPDSGKDWNTGTGIIRAPQLNYTFKVTETGKYYLYFLTSHPDGGGNSMLACLDGGTLLSCAKSSFGAGVWQSDSSWVFDIKEAGEHTLTVCAREDGIVLNEIVLSKSASEKFSAGKTVAESEREAIVSKGEFIAVADTVCIDLAAALENSAYAFAKSGSAKVNGADKEYKWEMCADGRGMQIYPYDTSMWSPSTLSSAPVLSYKVSFAAPGKYNVYLFTSYIDSSSDSVMISIADAAPVELTLTSSSEGSKRWLRSDSWVVNVESAGIHTVSIYARESGAVLHKAVLSASPINVGALDMYYSPRTETDRSVSYTNNGGAVLVTADGKSDYYQFTANKSGSFYITACAAAGGKGEAANVSVTGTDNISLNQNGGSVTLEAGKEYKVKAPGFTGYVYLSDKKVTPSVGTLILGDSYTSKTYWKNFDAQTADIDGRTIGVSGSKVTEWNIRYSEAALYAPENIVINIGVNDINGGTSGTACGNQIVRLINNLKSVCPDAKIFIITIANNNSHSNDGKWSEYAASNAIVKSFADAESNVYSIDYCGAMTEKAASMANKGYSGDNLHPSDEGYALLSELISKAVSTASNS